MSHTWRKLKAHTILDRVFRAEYDLTRLPHTVSDLGRELLNCEYVSIWTHVPSENVMINLVARFSFGELGNDSTLPAGELRIPLVPEPGRGIMVNLAWEASQGLDITRNPEHHYIVNDRSRDPRSRPADQAGAAGITSSMYAPMVFNGFKGMMMALNHETNHFTRSDFDVLEILATKTAMVLDILEARQRAEEAVRMAAIGRAIDLVRHELKTPLTAIKGAAFVIGRLSQREALEPADMEKLRQMSQIIEREVDRNTRLIDEIREFSRPELQLQKSPTDLVRFVQDAVPELQTVLHNPNIDISVDAPAGPIVVPIAPESILGVLRNLARNSVDQGSPALKLEVMKRDDHTIDGVRQYGVVAISDAGGGAEPRVLQELFQPYATHKKGGSGLGLFISKRIIEEGHAGRMTASNIFEDSRRIGLRVEIWLPANASATGRDTP